MIFLDTNVIIDILDEKRAFHNEALYILSAAQKGAIKAFTTSQSIIDASYVCTQTNKVSIEEFRKAISVITNILSIRAITEDDINNANQSDIPDYEDAAQLSCAERKECEMIITRDGKYKKYTLIKTYSVKEFFDMTFE